mmetsp:Transcript_21328/g.47940  ORF Transcript_21328/g.47940 Transcript_21328/m.47940 type:complete len:471 (+) Transcript_21328:568-1980(+)
MGAGESFPTLAHPQGRWAIPHDGRVRFACRINPALLPESMGVRPLPNTVARSTLRVSRRHTCGFHTKHVIKPANAVSRPYQLIERGVRAGDDRTLVGQAKFGCCILCDCSLPPCHFLLGQVSASAYPCTLRAAAWCAIGSPKPNRSGDLDEQRGILSVEEAVVCVPFVSRQEAWPSRHKRCSNRPGVSSSPWTTSDLLSPAASTASKPYPRPCVLRLDSPASHLTHCSKLVGACVGLAMAPTAGQRGFATGLRCSLPMCTGGRIRDLIAKGAAGTVGVASQWRNRLLKSSPKPPPALIEESARLLGIDEPWHFHAVPLGYVHRLIEYPVARGEELALSCGPNGRLPFCTRAHLCSHLVSRTVLEGPAPPPALCFGGHPFRVLDRRPFKSNPAGQTAHTRPGGSPTCGIRRQHEEHRIGQLGTRWHTADEIARGEQRVGGCCLPGRPPKLGLAIVRRLACGSFGMLWDGAT